MPTTTNIAVTNGDAIPILVDAGGGVYTAGANNARDVRQGLINAVVASLNSAVTPRTGILPRRWAQGESQWLDLKVSGQGSPSTTVTISAGQAVAVRTGEGPYLLTLTQDLNVVMDAANGSNPRWDVIGLMAYDKGAIPADATHGFNVVKVTGDPAGSPSVPTLPTGAIEIARILRASGSNGDLIGSGFTPITDMRKGTALHGARRALLPADSLADAGGYHGEIRVRTGSFVPTAIANLGVKVLNDYWDAVNAVWRGTQSITWPRQALTPVSNLGGSQTATLASVTIPDMGWAYIVEAAGMGLQGITGGATTALKDVYLQTTIDEAAFVPTPTARIILRSPRPNGAASPTQIVCPSLPNRSAQVSGPHVAYLIVRNESVPSNFIDVGENEYGGFYVTITPA